MKKAFFLLAIVFSLNSAANEIRSVDQKEKFESAKIWLGVPAGVFFGFGLGHGLQDRYVKDYGWAYTVAESFGLGLLILSYGDCRPSDTSCETDKDRQVQQGQAIVAIARAIEIADVSIWSFNYYKKNHTALFLTPQKNGAKVTASISF